MKKLLKLLFVMLFTLQLQAQETSSITGTVVDEDGIPFPSVNVLIKGTSDGTQTDIKGNYTIEAKAEDILAYSFVGYKTINKKVDSEKIINITMDLKVQSKDLVVTALGIKRKKDGISSSYRVVDNEEIVKANNRDVLSSLAGKVAGLTVIQTATGSAGVVIRGASNVRGGRTTQALIVVDGAITPASVLSSMDANMIKSVNVIKGLNGAALYGSQGANGVLVITTKNTAFIKNPAKSKKALKHKGKLKVKETEGKSGYIKQLLKSRTADAAFETYKKQKEEYKTQEGYLVDVYEFFAKKHKKSEYSKKILADILATQSENNKLLKAATYKIDETQNQKLAFPIYKRLLMLESQEVQSYLNIALAYQTVGLNQKSFDILNSIVSGSIFGDNAPKSPVAIQTIAKNEINKLAQKDNEIDKSELAKHNEINTVFDLRIVLEWNNKNTDVDLQIIDPSLEITNGDNPKSQIGGAITADDNLGLGPEEYTLINAKKGSYFVKLNYNSINDEDISSPTYAKITVYKNFGKKNETKKVKTVKFTKKKGEQIVTEVII